MVTGACGQSTGRLVVGGRRMTTTGAVAPSPEAAGDARTRGGGATGSAPRPAAPWERAPEAYAGWYAGVTPEGVAVLVSPGSYQRTLAVNARAACCQWWRDHYLEPFSRETTVLVGGPGRPEAPPEAGEAPVHGRMGTIIIARLEPRPVPLWPGWRPPTEPATPLRRLPHVPRAPRVPRVPRAAAGRTSAPGDGLPGAAVAAA
jgi:hypothetical protein